MRDSLLLFCCLAMIAIACHALLIGSELLIEPVSRRLANMSYFTWMVSFLCLCQYWTHDLCRSVLVSVIPQCTKSVTEHTI